MKDPLKMSQNYEAGVRARWQGVMPEAKIRDMVERYAAAISAQYALLAQVQQALAMADEPTMLYPYYYAFARKLFRLSYNQEVSGEALAVEAELQTQLWVGRGLARSVLECIRLGVFNISPPASP